MKKLLAVLLFILIVVTSPAAQSEQWTAFVCQEGQFSILIPNPRIPQDLAETVIDQHLGVLKSHTYRVEGEMIAVSVAWFDYPADVKIDSAEALNEAQEQGILGLKGFKGQISAKKITLGDYPGVEITAKNETSLLRFRTYIVGHRNYTLFAATLAEEPDQERVAKFFNSFRLRRPGRIG